MRKAAAIALLLLAACSTTTTGPSSLAEVEFQQVYGPKDLSLVRGNNTMQIEYAVRVGNRGTEPITLRRISVSSVGSGSYALRPEEQAYNVAIPPDTAQAVKLTARGYFSGTSTSEASREPVMLRAILYFDAPAGSFRKIVTQNLGQFPGGE
jgi:hypothetical protein